MNINLSQAVWPIFTEIKNTTSVTIENLITTYVKDLITKHPQFLQFLQIFGWLINHPIISLVILLLIIALAGTIIKGIVRLIETVIWLILQLPVKFLKIVSITSFNLLNNLIKGNLRNNQVQENNQDIFPVTVLNSTIISEDKKQRLAEISDRLQLIHHEQQQLLQEAATLIDRENY